MVQKNHKGSEARVRRVSLTAATLVAIAIPSALHAQENIGDEVAS